MPREVNTLIIAERAAALNVITPHGQLAQIVSERCHPQRKPIASAEMKCSPQVIGNCGDPRRVWVRVSFELVSARAEVPEDLDHVRLAIFYGIKRRHFLSLW